jgi:hypothetical protein
MSTGEGLAPEMDSVESINPVAANENGSKDEQNSNKFNAVVKRTMRSCSKVNGIFRNNHREVGGGGCHMLIQQSIGGGNK